MPRACVSSCACWLLVRRLLIICPSVCGCEPVLSSGTTKSEARVITRILPIKTPGKAIHRNGRLPVFSEDTRLRFAAAGITIGTFVVVVTCNFPVEIVAGTLVVDLGADRVGGIDVEIDVSAPFISGCVSCDPDDMQIRRYTEKIEIELLYT